MWWASDFPKKSNPLSPLYLPPDPSDLGKEMVAVNPAANRGDQRAYASQNFAWRLLGKTPEQATPLDAAPSVLLSRLLEHTCPGYGAVLGKRYGAKQLLIEQEWIADLAFLAGVYRYSRIAGDAYPCGLHTWPCTAAWWTRAPK